MTCKYSILQDLGVFEGFINPDGQRSGSSMRSSVTSYYPQLKTGQSISKTIIIGKVNSAVA